MKIYVAGSSKDLELARKVINAVREANHTITYNWTINVQESIEDPTLDEDIEWLQGHAYDDLRAVETADVIIAIMGDQKQRGTHIELGYAIAKNKPIYLLNGDYHNCIFYTLPNMHCYNDIESILEVL